MRKFRSPLGYWYQTVPDIPNFMRFDLEVNCLRVNSLLFRWMLEHREPFNISKLKISNKMELTFVDGSCRMFSLVL